MKKDCVEIHSFLLRFGENRNEEKRNFYLCVFSLLTRIVFIHLLNIDITQNIDPAAIQILHLVRGNSLYSSFSPWGVCCGDITYYTACRAGACKGVRQNREKPKRDMTA